MVAKYCIDAFITNLIEISNGEARIVTSIVIPLHAMTCKICQAIIWLLADSNCCLSWIDHAYNDFSGQNHASVQWYRYRGVPVITRLGRRSLYTRFYQGMSDNIYYRDGSFLQNSCMYAFEILNHFSKAFYDCMKLGHQFRF